jgi:NAD(P)-dependent dehydrogenase (short-subunit alcohol dehydrogenase family)
LSIHQLFSLDGRVAAVTGAGSGLGREIAIAYADAGACVVALDLDADAAAATASERDLIEAGAADVRDAESVERALPDRVDVLVNAAGVGGWGETLSYPDELWRRVLDTNLTGTFVCCRAAGRRMVPARRGSIVNLASTLGLVGFPGTVAYVASKGGVVQLTRALAVEWAALGVRVNAIAPSTFETPLVRRNRHERPEVYERLLAATPIGRFGEQHEIIGPALFLASDAASMVTGHVLAADGGYLAQ